MICNGCQRQAICLLSQMAKGDKQLQKMLKRLKQCDLRIGKSA